MADAHGVGEGFRRYAELIGGTVAPVKAFIPEAESATAMQVERGELLVMAVKGERDDEAVASRVERLLAHTRSGGRLNEVAVVDRRGHHRPVYRAILIYSFLQSFRLWYETLPQAQFGRWEEASRAWADLLEAELTTVGWDESTTWAARGATAAELCWMGLGLHVAGKAFVRDAFTDLASDLFGKLVRAQQPGGAFLLAQASDNPETHWYHELVILHAAASYAVQAEDRAVASAVKRATDFHLNETQPDHASAQPFGVFAFVWTEGTRGLADQVLHSVQVQQPEGVEGLPGVLLADSLYCLRLFV